MTDSQLKAICDAILLGVWAEDSLLSLMEFEVIHQTSMELRKRIIQEINLILQRDTLT